ncbi:hypothetical protein BH23BAC1_BH23BAC1_05200 [soil metagenome]
MAIDIITKILSKFQLKPNSELIAQQLRMPSGKFALKVAEKMNQSNEFLYDLTIEAMDLQEREFVLEIGFGNGSFFNKIFSKAKGLNITGLDYSKEMVEAAKANNKENFVLGKMHFVLGNSNDMPFAYHSFHKAFAINVIYFWEKPEIDLAEIRRVLKPKGRFYTSIRTKETMQHLPFIQHGFNLYEIEEWQEILEKNGFKIINTVKKEEPALTIDGDKFFFEAACIAAEKIE